MTVCGNYCSLRCLQGFWSPPVLYQMLEICTPYFPSVVHLVGSWWGLWKHNWRSFFSFFITLLPLSQVYKVWFKRTQRAAKSEVDKGHSRCRAFGNVDRWSLLGHLGLPHELAFTQRHVVMVLWSGFPRLHALTVRELKWQALSDTILSNTLDQFSTRGFLFIVVLVTQCYGQEAVQF